MLGGNRKGGGALLPYHSLGVVIGTKVRRQEHRDWSCTEGIPAQKPLCWFLSLWKMETITNCGTPNHPSECLCDVELKDPVVAISIPLRDRWFGHSIMEYKQWSEASMGSEQLLEFFQMQVAVKDQECKDVVKQPNLQHQPNRKRMLRPEVTELIGTRVLQKTASGAIRREVDERYGIKISESHMSHLRKRLIQKWA